MLGLRWRWRRVCQLCVVRLGFLGHFFPPKVIGVCVTCGDTTLYLKKYFLFYLFVKCFARAIVQKQQRQEIN
eukprot:m.4511 g.4511  ORF g.4511 m.4511 type:complete len:72 (-) comp2240_c0_seq1:52-267(-)